MSIKPKVKLSGLQLRLRKGFVVHVGPDISITLLHINRDYEALVVINAPVEKYITWEKPVAPGTLKDS